MDLYNVACIASNHLFRETRHVDYVGSNIITPTISSLLQAYATELVWLHDVCGQIGLLMGGQYCTLFLGVINIGLYSRAQALLSAQIYDQCSQSNWDWELYCIVSFTMFANYNEIPLAAAMMLKFLYGHFTVYQRGSTPWTMVSIKDTAFTYTVSGIADHDNWFLIRRSNEVSVERRIRDRACHRCIWLKTNPTYQSCRVSSIDIYQTGIKSYMRQFPIPADWQSQQRIMRMEVTQKSHILFVRIEKVVVIVRRLDFEDKLFIDIAWKGWLSQNVSLRRPHQRVRERSSCLFVQARLFWC